MNKILLALLLTVAVAGLGVGCKPSEEASPKPKPPEVLTAEEKVVRKEARALGDRLYEVVKKEPEPRTVADEEIRQQKLSPVYDDIEKFIFRQLQPFRDRIASITVVYKNSGILCIVYIKNADEDAELASLKRATDSCVGKIIDGLPMVKYLIVRTQHD